MVQGGAGDAMETHARFFEHSQRFHRPGQVQRGRQFAPTPPTSCRLDAKPNGWLTHRESEAARTPMPSDMWDRGSDDTSSWLDAYTPTRGWTGKTSTSATRGGNDRQRRMQGGIWLDEGSEIKSPSVHSKKRLGPTFSTVLDFEAPGSHSRDTSYQDAFPTSKSSPARIAPCTVNRMSIRPQTAQDPAFHPGRWQCLDPTSDERVRDFFERFWTSADNCFQVRLETCIEHHGSRTSLSLRHATEYDALAERLQHAIEELNERRHALRPRTVSSSKTFDRENRRSIRKPEYTVQDKKCSFPVLDFVRNEASCLPPPGAKGARSGNLPRYGAFEVVVAVYRGNEGHWHEFLIYSKLGTGKFPNVAALNARLESLLSSSLEQLKAAEMIQAQIARLQVRRAQARRAWREERCFLAAVIRRRLTQGSFLRFVESHRQTELLMSAEKPLPPHHHPFTPSRQPVVLFGTPSRQIRSRARLQGTIRRFLQFRRYQALRMLGTYMRTVLLQQRYHAERALAKERVQEETKMQAETQIMLSSSDLQQEYERLLEDQHDVGIAVSKTAAEYDALLHPFKSSSSDLQREYERLLEDQHNVGIAVSKAAAECDALLHNVNCVVLSAAVECDALLLQHNLVRSKMSVLEAERDRSLEEVGALHSQVRLLEESKEHYLKEIKTLHAQVSSLEGQKKTLSTLSEIQTEEIEALNARKSSDALRADEDSRHRCESAALVLQRAWRCAISRRILEELFCGDMERIEALNRDHAVLLLQRAWRCTAARRRLRLYAAAFLRRVVDEISAAPYETDDEAPGTPSYSRGSDDDTCASRADDDAWVVPYAEDFETEDDDLKFSHAGLVLQQAMRAKEARSRMQELRQARLQSMAIMPAEGWGMMGRRPSEGMLVVGDSESPNAKEQVEIDIAPPSTEPTMHPSGHRLSLLVLHEQDGLHVPGRLRAAQRRAWKPSRRDRTWERRWERIFEFGIGCFAIVFSVGLVMLLVFWPLITGTAPPRGVGSGEAVGGVPGAGKGGGVVGGMGATSFPLTEAQSPVTTAVAPTSTPSPNTAPQSIVTAATVTSSPAPASTSTHNYDAGFTSTPPVNPANTLASTTPSPNTGSRR